MANWNKEIAKINEDIQNLDNKITLNKKGKLDQKLKKPQKNKIFFNEEGEE